MKEIAELKRYLQILERAENNPEVWEYLTSGGTGIATLNGYRNAISSIERTEGRGEEERLKAALFTAQLEISKETSKYALAAQFINENIFTIWKGTKTTLSFEEYLASVESLLNPVPTVHVSEEEIERMAEKEIPMFPVYADQLQNLQWKDYINHLRMEWINGFKAALNNKP
jgi:hypothetical protein